MSNGKCWRLVALLWPDISFVSHPTGHSVRPLIQTLLMLAILHRIKETKHLYQILSVVTYFSDTLLYTQKSSNDWEVFSKRDAFNYTFTRFEAKNESSFHLFYGFFRFLSVVRYDRTNQMWSSLKCKTKTKIILKHLRQNWFRVKNIIK